MENMDQKEVVEWLDAKGFEKQSPTVWALGNIRASFSKNTRHLFVTVRDAAQHSNRLQNFDQLISYLLKCMQIRDTYMEHFRVFCENVKTVFNESHHMALDVVLGPRAEAKFLFHGYEIFSLELDVEYNGHDKPLQLDYWCPDFETEVEVPQDIVNAAKHAYKHRCGPTMIKDGNTVVTTENPQAFMAIMFTNPCLGIQKSVCEVREVSDVSDMQWLLDAAPRTRNVSMYKMEFGNYVILDPVEPIKTKRRVNHERDDAEDEA